MAGCCIAINSSQETYSVPENAIELEARVAEVYGNSGAIVTIVSDDGFFDGCMNLHRIFQERNLKCTVAGAIRNIEPYKNEWEEILSQGTIDLVSHSWNHAKMQEGTEISKDENGLKKEIVEADEWYEDWLGNEQIAFVCPNNEMCDLGYKIIGEHDFWAVRRGDRGYNPISPKEGTEPGQWYNLKVQGICDDGVDTMVRNKWVDTAINDGTWLIEMWHNVMPEDDGKYQTILISEAEQHVDYLAEKSESKEIWLATYTDAVKYIREKQNSCIYAYIDDDNLHIYLELTNSKMSYNTFNHPLTILINLPEDYEVKETEQYTEVNGILTTNIVPGEEMIISLVN